MGEWLDLFNKEEAIEDSLRLAQSKQDSTALALEQIEIEKAKSDSTAEANIGVIPEDERTGMIPIVKLAKDITGSTVGKFARGTYGQAVHTVGSTVLNIAGIPLNYWSKWLTGYNPGFSGERTMDRILGVGEDSIAEGWAGLGEDEMFPGSFGKDPDKAWGTPAPEGKGKYIPGEWLWETAEREAKEKAAKTKKKKI